MAEQKDQPEHEEGGWQYRPEGATASVPVSVTDDAKPHPHSSNEDVVEWTASEFIAHQKGISWYTILALGTIFISLVIYLVTHDLVNVLVLVLLGSMIGVTASRPPRIVSYRLDRGGLTIGKSFHPFGVFKSYAIIKDGAFASITILPLKRFDFPINIYFSPEDEHAIMEVLSKYLPLQQGDMDNIDRLMRSLHF